MKKHVSLAIIALATAMTSTAATAGDIKVKGKVFFDYAAHSTTPNGGTAKKSIGGNVARTYITAKKKIDKVWSTRVTIDSAYDKSTAIIGLDKAGLPISGGTLSKKNNVFLKYAYLKGKFSDELNVKLGLIATPWIGYQDKLNQHRYISKSFVDTHKMASSADVGIGVFGKALDGMISYDVVTINGRGYGNTKATEKTDLELRVGVAPIKGLTIDFGYRDGYMGGYKAGVGTTATVADKKTLTQALVTYGQKLDNMSYRVAFNTISNKKTFSKVGKASVTEKGTEIWAMARMGKMGAYFRNESFDNGVAADAIEKRTVVSVDYHVAKGAVVSLVSDTITNAGNTSGDKKSKTGLFTQFKF